MEYSKQPQTAQASNYQQGKSFAQNGLLGAGIGSAAKEVIK